MATFDDLNRAALNWAFAFLDRWFPNESRQLWARIDRVAPASGVCGVNAYGCVRPEISWTMYLDHSPAWTRCVELLLTLLHESWHVKFAKGEGAWVLIPHTCRNCRDPSERALDPFYEREEKYRPVIVSALIADGLEPYAYPPVHPIPAAAITSAPERAIGGGTIALGILGAVAAGGVGFLVGAAIGEILRPRNPRA